MTFTLRYDFILVEIYCKIRFWFGLGLKQIVQILKYSFALNKQTNIFSRFIYSNGAVTPPYFHLNAGV